jgi:hypothetical protein
MPVGVRQEGESEPVEFTTSAVVSAAISNTLRTVPIVYIPRDKRNRTCKPSSIIGRSEVEEVSKTQPYCSNKPEESGGGLRTDRDEDPESPHRSVAKDVTLYE